MSDIPWQLLSAVGAIFVFIDRKLESKSDEQKKIFNTTQNSLEEIKTTVLKIELKTDKRMSLIESEIRNEINRIDKELQTLKEILSALDEANGGL